MISFINDYQEGCISEIINILNKNNYSAYSGYGEDSVCDYAKHLIKLELKRNDCDVHFIAGGTLTNKIVISSFLRSYECIICAESGHIATHETGAIELGGHKVITVKTKNGKVTAEDVHNVCREYKVSSVKDHVVKPGMLYISQSTEVGTVYTLEELRSLSEICKYENILFYIDGARILYSLFSKDCDFTLADVASLCDIFYIGGTKAGALFGEALVINKEELKPNFRAILKQNGALTAKGFVLGAQFVGLFENGNYKKYCKKAVELADSIRNAFRSKGVELEFDSQDTQTFVVVTKSQFDMLYEHFLFGAPEMRENDKYSIRFCTSWATDEMSVFTLICLINKF